MYVRKDDSDFEKKGYFYNRNKKLIHFFDDNKYLQKLTENIYVRRLIYVPMFFIFALVSGFIWFEGESLLIMAVILTSVVLFF